MRRGEWRKKSTNSSRDGGDGAEDGDGAGPCTDCDHSTVRVIRNGVEVGHVAKGRHSAQAPLCDSPKHSRRGTRGKEGREKLVMASRGGKRVLL